MARSRWLPAPRAASSSTRTSTTVSSATTSATSSTQAFSPTYRTFMQGVVHRLVSHYDLEGKRVIEVGCGQGEFLEQLRLAGVGSITGVDPAFDHTRPAFQSASNVDVVARRFEQSTAGEPADLVACLMTLEHIEAPRRFLENSRREVLSKSRTRSSICRSRMRRNSSPTPPSGTSTTNTPAISPRPPFAVSHNKSACARLTSGLNMTSSIWQQNSYWPMIEKSQRFLKTTSQPFSNWHDLSPRGPSRRSPVGNRFSTKQHPKARRRSSGAAAPRPSPS